MPGEGDDSEPVVRYRNMTVTINLAVLAASDDEAELIIHEKLKELVQEHWERGKWQEGDTVKLHNYTSHPYRRKTLE